MYTKEKKLDKEESELEHRIRELDDRLNAGCNSTNMALTFITEKEKLKQNLEILRENKLNGSLIRSKAKIYESMGKPSTLFCNLEKRNYTNKLVNRVVVDYVVNSLNEAFNKGELSVTQKQGIITLLPKGDKPREFLKNWRPISLLNVDYKLLAGTMANRMKKVLPNIINQEQKGFLKKGI